MKSFIALALVALIAVVMADLHAEHTALYKQYGLECIEQENVTKEEALKLKNRDFAGASENLKCFAKCFFEKSGTVKDGVVQEAVVLLKLGALIGEEKTKAILAQCTALKGESKCDTAFKFFECFENEKAKLNV